MTLIVGWLACDQRGPCSAYIASDSRISDNRNFYDYSQKTFALKNTPDILGYCGETLFTYQILTRLTSMCDVGMLLSADMDYQDRSEIIFNEIKRAHSAYKLNNGIIKIYHIGRNKKRIKAGLSGTAGGRDVQVLRDSAEESVRHHRQKSAESGIPVKE
jgi:hypothetical protein